LKKKRIRVSQDEVKRFEKFGHPENPYPGFCHRVMIYRDIEMAGCSPHEVDGELWSAGRKFERRR